MRTTPILSATEDDKTRQFKAKWTNKEQIERQEIKAQTKTILKLRPKTKTNTMTTDQDQIDQDQDNRQQRKTTNHVILVHEKHKSRHFERH
jgi:hypothetical protein